MKVDNLDLKFLEFSESKLFKLCPNIVDMPKEMNKPVYDLLIGVETMDKLDVILDFSSKEIVIDKISQPMKPFERLTDLNALNKFHRDHLEPNSTCKETKCTMEILDAKYEKANLAEVLEENCGHLSSLQ